jgi:hypothetical protein
MTHVQRLQKEISTLSPGDYSALVAWLEAYDAAKWDEQLQQDAGNGKLDALAAEALLEVETSGGSRL